MTDFAPGDVVVCIDTSRRQFGIHWGAGTGLKLGALYRVLDTGLHPIAHHPVIYTGAHPDGYAVERFRKLKAADEQFTEQMRALQPAKEPVK